MNPKATNLFESLGPPIARPGLGFFVGSRINSAVGSRINSAVPCGLSSNQLSSNRPVDGSNPSHLSHLNLPPSPFLLCSPLASPPISPARVNSPPSQSPTSEFLIPSPAHFLTQVPSPFPKPLYLIVDGANYFGIEDHPPPPHVPRIRPTGLLLWNLTVGLPAVGLYPLRTLQRVSSPNLVIPNSTLQQPLLLLPL